MAVASLWSGAAAGQLLSFELDAQVAARFASTTLSLRFYNRRACTQLETLKIQKPRNARLSTLTIATPDCVTTGAIEATATAVTRFESAAARGVEGAILHSYDLDSLMLQVSISPHAPLNVTLTYEEVVERKGGNVSIVLPLAPGLPAERISASLTVDEPAGVESLECQAEGVWQSSSSSSSSRRLGATLALESSVEIQHSVLSDTSASASITVAPAATRATSGFAAKVACAYRPSPLPDAGMVLFSPSTPSADAANATFMYLFSPPSVATPMARRVQLVVDVSGSMSGSRLRDAKLAAAQIVGLLSEHDDLAMVSFSSTLHAEAAFPWEAVTASAQQRAASWIANLQAGGGTNLEEAARLGLDQLTSLAAAKKVPLLILLTDGEATNGVTEHSAIRTNARAANLGGAASVWSFALGAAADYNLLLGLSVDAGGNAYHVYEGYGTSVAVQIAAAAAAALGSVVLSNVRAVLSGVANATSTFPLLASGSEVLVMGSCTACVGGALVVNTTASAAEGAVAFSATAPLSNSSAAMLPSHLASSLLRRLKHTQVGQIMATSALYRAAGNAHAARAAKAQALQLALAPPRLVWPGLTTMVATRDASCDADATSNGTAYAAAPPQRCEGGGPAGAEQLPKQHLDPVAGSSAVNSMSSYASISDTSQALTAEGGSTAYLGIVTGVLSTLGLGICGALIWVGVGRRRRRRAQLQKQVAYQRQLSGAAGAPLTSRSDSEAL